MKRLAAALVFFAGLVGAVEIVKVFRGRGLFTGAPSMNAWPTAEPGTTAPLTRPYAGAPPLIPHGIAGLRITRENNDCLACHLEGIEVSEGHRATKVPPSHRLNPYTKQTQEDGVVATRYQCRQCHVPQDTIARPPVPQAP
jgi:nitrate reductase cytochrome c-type subunit